MREAFSQSELSRYYDTAILLANEGGEVLRHYWGHLKTIESKEGSGNLVTEADKASEQTILTLLAKAFPTHDVLAEESGEHSSGNTSFLWAIDPLDGTTNYAHMLPMVSVSIALLYDGKPIVGVVYNPILDHLFAAKLGGGTTLNGKEIHVSAVKELEKSLLATGFAYDRRTARDNNYPQFVHFTDITQGVRRMGSAALDLAYVASGTFDGYWERGIQPWDISAGVLLVTEAGGRVTGYDGRPVDLFSGQILATNGHLHQTMSEILAFKYRKSMVNCPLKRKRI